MSTPQFVLVPSSGAPPAVSSPQVVNPAMFQTPDQSQQRFFLQTPQGFVEASLAPTGSSPAVPPGSSSVSVGGDGSSGKKQGETIEVEKDTKKKKNKRERSQGWIDFLERNDIPEDEASDYDKFQYKDRDDPMERYRRQRDAKRA